MKKRIIAVIGYCLIVAGIIPIYFFHGYTGQSWKGLETAFFQNAVEKYSIAAVTGDRSYDWSSKNFRYFVVRYSDEDRVRDAIRYGKTDDLIIEKSAYSSKDLEVIRDSLAEREKNPHVNIKAYTYSSGNSYQLSYGDNWPFDTGLNSIQAANVDVWKTEAQYVVVSYVPQKLVRDDDLFSRITGAVEKICLLLYGGIAAFVIGLIITAISTVWIVKSIIAAGKNIREKEYLKKDIKDMKRRYRTVSILVAASDIVLIILVLSGRGGLIAALIIFVIKEIILLRSLHRTSQGFEMIKKSTGELTGGNITYKADGKNLPVAFRQTVDDLNSMGEAMDAAVDERLRSEHMQTELITNVSHDIRTPLTSITGCVDLLSKPDVSDADREEYLGIMKKQSIRLKKLINDLIEASRAESGKVELHPEDINVSTLIGMMAGEYEERLKQKNITLDTSICDEEVHITADPQQLGRVFENLFENMYKYSLPGSRAYVDLEKDGKVIFRNISAAKLHIRADELTERFVRGDASRTTEGSGLGLSIAKNLTELMGGEFNIEIDGDLFKVTLIFS